MKRIRVVFPPTNATPFKSGFIGDEELSYETEDSKVLDTVSAFLRHPLRLAAPEDMHGCRGSGFTLGKILVTTNKDTFEIEITCIGFLLGDSPDFHTLFYSWGLAHFLDDLCARHRSVHVPPVVMNMLTGEWRMQEDKKFLEQMKQGQKKGDSEKE